MVLGYDGSPAAKAAADEEIALAKERGECDIVVVSTHERLPQFDRMPFLLGRIDESQWRREWRDSTEQDLHHEVTRIRLAGVEARPVCSPDDPIDLLQRVAVEIDAECIVVADDRGGALRDALVGSIAKRLRRVSKIPVVVVGDER